MSKKISKLLFIMLLLIFVLPACYFSDEQEGSENTLPENQRSFTQTPVATKTSTKAFSEIPAIPNSEGPFLLIQTEVDAYHLIDIANQKVTPYLLPGGGQQVNLGQSLSPSGSQMILPLNDQKIGVFSFSTGQVHTTYHLKSDSSYFQAELALESVRDLLPYLNYSDERVLQALENALLQSNANIQWYTSDRYRLTVLEGSSTSTHLHLDDHQTGIRRQLEAMPGLVEAYQIEPAGERILLKKSFLFEPGIWQDDQYFLLNPDRHTADFIPLPPDADNPAVFWFTHGQIGIIHQPQVQGGENFSIIDAETGVRTQIIQGHFTEVHSTGSQIISLDQNREDNRTAISLWDVDGKIIASQTIAGLCSLKAPLPGKNDLFNCDSESFLIQEDTLLIEPFTEQVAVISPSPDSRQFIIISQDQQISLYSASLKPVSSFDLEGIPKEVLWLPDSSGFLYRTEDQLLYYDLNAYTSEWLFTSNFFMDYRNLNAVWIKIP